MSHIESLPSSPPILIPKIKKTNIPFTPKEYFETVEKQYLEEKLIRLKYLGETFYTDEEEDTNNVYTDDQHTDDQYTNDQYTDVCDNSYFSPSQTLQHLEDDDFTLTTFNTMFNTTFNTTFNYNMKNENIQ